MLAGLVGDDIGRFVDEYVDSLVSWAIIVFYHENPGARDRAEELALHLGRRIDDVAKAAERLSEKGLLSRLAQERDIIYLYQPDKELQSKVTRFVQSLDEREVRLAVLSRVLEKAV
ncbi:MAG: hypothetical protein M1548_05985 [Actinobacteria bacterium]|nr:hypothetical protein [Actinomycetota bacterium]